MCQSSVSCNTGSSTIILNDKPHRCSHCQKRFERASSLRLHLHSHFGLIPYLCNICRKEFRNVGSYKAHVNSHTGERPFICKICNRRYVRNKYATGHVKCHLFKKPYKCSNCIRGYFRKRELNYHARSKHTLKTRKIYNECDRDAVSNCRRFYLCKICRKQFSSVSNRNEHQCKSIIKRVVFNPSVENESSTCTQNYKFL